MISLSLIFCPVSMMCVVDGNGKSYNIICMICVCSIKGSPTATQLMNTTPSCLGRALFILPYANVICSPLMRCSGLQCSGSVQNERTSEPVWLVAACILICITHLANALREMSFFYFKLSNTPNLNRHFIFHSHSPTCCNQ